MKPPQRLLLTAFCALAFIAQRNDAHGDGGQIVHVERSDDLLITVFAAPNPLAAGPIDFSFLVQNATELQLVDAVEIAVTCRLLDKESESISIVAPATRDQATNKLLQAATVNLPTAGKWLVGVAVRANDRSLEFDFPIEVSDSLPPAPWRIAVALPLSVIALFGIHRYLKRRPRPTYSSDDAKVAPRNRSSAAT